MTSSETIYYSNTYNRKKNPSKKNHNQKNTKKTSNIQYNYTQNTYQKITETNTDHKRDINCFLKCFQSTLEIKKEDITQKNHNNHRNKSTQKSSIYKGKINSFIRHQENKISNYIQEDINNCLPLDLIKHQKYVLDKCYPTLSIWLIYNLTEKNEFSNLDNNYKNAEFSFSINGTIHNVKAFKDDINFCVKGLEILKKILYTVNCFNPIYDCETYELDITVWNNISFLGIKISISKKLLYIIKTMFNNKVFISDIIDNTILQNNNEINILSIVYKYTLPYTVFYNKDALLNLEKNKEFSIYSNMYQNCYQKRMLLPNKNNQQYTNSYNSPTYINYSNFNLFISKISPIIYESEDTLIKSIFNQLTTDDKIYGLPCTFLLSKGIYTKVVYRMYLNSLVIDYKKSIDISHDNSEILPSNITANTDNSSSMDNNFTNISSSNEEKHQKFERIYFNNKELPLYLRKYLIDDIDNLFKENYQLNNIKLNDINSETSYFSIIFSPIKCAQPISTDSIKFYESNIHSNFEIYFSFRNQNITNSVQRLKILGIKEIDYNGHIIDSTINNDFNSFWFMNRSADSNYYLFEQDLTTNKNAYLQLFKISNSW